VLLPQTIKFPNRQMNKRKPSDFTVIPGTGGREREIDDLVLAAFRKRFGTGPEEVAILSALRGDGDVALELVALERHGALLGHAMFSRMRVEPAACTAAALGPVAARIDRQRQGIGQALIGTGLEVCRATGVDVVAVLGDAAYYARFGFSAALAAPIACPFAGPHFQVLELRQGASRGVAALDYAPAFQSPSR